MRKCKLCKEPTGIYLPEHRLALCPACYPGWLEKQTARTLKKYKMLVREDKILLAVSGGKDSLALWQILTNLGCEVDGIYVDLGISDNNYSEISKEKCLKMQEKLGRKLFIIDLKAEAGGSIDSLGKAYKNTCSACGSVKRYFMNKVTLEEGYTVIATGHNMDDEVTTLFGNLIQWDESYLTRQYPVNPAKDGLAKKIKPLVRNSERQIAIYSLVSGIDYIREECPHSLTATSVTYKEALSRLEAEKPGILQFFLGNFFRKKKQSTLIKDDAVENPDIKPCSRCGQPTTSEVCRYCKIKEKVSLTNAEK